MTGALVPVLAEGYDSGGSSKSARAPWYPD